MLQWQENLDIGIPEIDAQHRELFDRLSRFLEACDEGRGKEELVSMLQFLDDYVGVHFKAEEEFQKKIDFEGRKEHRKLHQRFRQDLLDAKRRFIVEGPTDEVIAAINRLVVGWLVEHISTFDREMAAAFKEDGLFH